MDSGFYIYILTNRRRGTLYVGVTANLVRRIIEHRQGTVPGFTTRYRLRRLVHFEHCREAHAAFTREKQLKRWRRQWKIQLIEATNPNWKDLYHEIIR